MKRKSTLMFLVVLLLCVRAANPQTVVERLDILEAKVDSLLAILKAQLVKVPAYEIISDNQHLLYGIASASGTVIDKEYFVINHNNDWKTPEIT